MKDELGDRMKRYEAASNAVLTPRMPVLIRVDGRSFHTFTRGCEKPYDQNLIDAMAYATRMTAAEMQGFKLGYVQSDEATFMITDTDTLESQGWFGYEVNKLVSITASAFTAHFNAYWQRTNGWESYPQLAEFDARCFNVPVEDVPNAFVWRQRDWERNSLQMLARSHFSQKQLHGKKTLDMRMMLLNNDVDDLLRTDQQQFGTFIERDGSYTHNRESYETIEARL
jgi:tRNA(His) guanylyltransferase